MVITGVLYKAGYDNVISCSDSRMVMDFFYRYNIEAVLLDLKMPYLDGESLLQTIKQRFPEIPVIVVTGKTDVEVAVHCMKAGAFDYIAKPVEAGRLISAVKRALEVRELKRENTALKKHFLSEKLENPDAFSGIITNDRKMLSIFQYIESIAQTHHPVLITGETGVGKELIVQVIHSLSGLQGKMVSINMAGLDDIVFSDTIFGHVKGAYTGAQLSRGGLIEKAAGGTLFLDEIGDIGMEAQVKLLRLIQEGEYYALGSDELKKSRVRVITSTNKDLWALEKKGGFRSDLIYRLQTHHIHIPPLAQRKGDIPLLTRYFVDRAAKSLEKNSPSLPNELLALLQTYSFKGNIRELESMVFDAISQHQGEELSLKVFREYIQQRQAEEPQSVREKRIGYTDLYDGLAVLPTLKNACRQLVLEAISRTGGNQSEAARILGITQPALNYRLKKERLHPKKQKKRSSIRSK